VYEESDVCCSQEGGVSMIVIKWPAYEYGYYSFFKLMLFLMYVKMIYFELFY
jgi:hypothetical protein